MGAYTVGNGLSGPIRWVKAAKDNTLISACVLDFLAFDAPDRDDSSVTRFIGSRDYESSNILQFLNSSEEYWFSPATEFDNPPSLRATDSWDFAYGSHAGFLSEFQDYELACLDGGVDLPRFADIVGNAAFPLFRRKGTRAHATAELCQRKLNTMGMDTSSFVAYWTRDPSVVDSSYVLALGRDGNGRDLPPYTGCGLRPICRLKPNTLLESDENGVLRIKAFVVAEEHSPIAAEELLRYLKLSS